MSKISKPLPAAKKSVCFGTVEKWEWHVDYSLVPKSSRARAVRMFHNVVKADKVGYGCMILVFHHATKGLEIQAQKRGFDVTYVGEVVE